MIGVMPRPTSWVRLRRSVPVGLAMVILVGCGGSHTGATDAESAKAAEVVCVQLHDELAREFERFRSAYIGHEAEGQRSLNGFLSREAERERSALAEAASRSAALMGAAVLRLQTNALSEPAQGWLRLVRQHRREVIEFKHELPAHLGTNPEIPLGWYHVLRERDQGCRPR